MLSAAGFLAGGLGGLLALRARARSRAPPPADSSSSVVVSAPGKVLITGGYLVLERPNGGLVLGATARFHSRATLLPADAAPATATAADTQDVTVLSPQFHQRLQLRLRRDAATRVWRVAEGGGRNSYVEGTVAITLTALEALAPPRDADADAPRAPLEIELKADNDFYSQLEQLHSRGLPVSRASLRELPASLPCPLGADGQPRVAKTGMGSSAALITSLVAALLKLLGGVDDRDVVHRLAQTAHMLAQGKVGSGFDVSAAVFGSHRYVRFSPDVLQALPAEPSPAALAACCQGGSAGWDEERTAFALPAGLVLLMGDVNGGSETPGMVRKVLAWRKTEASEPVWRALDAANGAVEAALRAGDLAAVPGLFREVRALLRRMGDGAGVPIEPAAQTALADETMAVEGVLMSGVPGAGGNDAIFAVVDGQEAAERVAAMWAARGNVCPLLLSVDADGGLVYSS